MDNNCKHDFSVMVDGEWTCIICGTPRSAFKHSTPVLEKPVFSAVFNINIEYKIKADTAEEAEEKAKTFMANMAELPENYVSDSVEFVEVVEE